MSDLSIIDKNAHYFVLMHPYEITAVMGVVITTKSNLTRPKWVECVIDESRFKLSDGHRIQLTSLEPGYGSEVYYTDDFISMIKRGDAVKKEPDMECVEESWKEPLTQNVHLCHSAYTLKIKPKK